MEAEQEILPIDTEQEPLEPQTPQKSGLTELFGTILVVTGILIFLSLISFQYQISQDEIPQSGTNLIGTVGHYTAQLLFYLFGKSCFLAGPSFFLLGILTIYRGGFTDPLSRLVALITLMIGSSLLGGMFFIKEGQVSEAAGGLISVYLGGGLVSLFGYYGAMILSFGVFFAGLFLSIRIPIPIFLNALNVSFRGGLEKYSGVFTQNLYYPEPATVGVQVPSQVIKHKEISSDQKSPPWIEKVSVDEDQNTNATQQSFQKQEAVIKDHERKEVEHTSPPPRNVSKNNDWMSASRDRNKNFQIHENKGFFEHPSSNHLPDTQKVRVGFDGYFAQNETRFHFNGSTFTPEWNQKNSIQNTKSQEESFVSGVMNKQDETSSSFATTLMDPIDFPFPTVKKNSDDVKGLSIGVVEDVVEQSDQIMPYVEDEISEMEVAEESIDEPVLEYCDPLLIETVSEEKVDIDPVIKSPVLPENELFVESDVPEFHLATNKYFVPVDILSSTKRIPLDKVENDINKTRRRLEQVFQDYGIQASVVHSQRGPIITLYEIKPAPGVKVARILGIIDEIKMNLEAQSIRIIAPIPGKATVGIEIPNQHRESVALKDMVTKSGENKEGLNIVLGADINGDKVFTDLTRLPHLLIAGATGSGKSVYMNAVIASLLYHYSPEDLRFIMIDPKMVELRLFEGIPHLIMPVITDVRKANKALAWAVAEMERRYAVLSSMKCRDIRSYNDRVASNKATGKEGVSRSMPYMVVLIDELADLMMVAAKDVEDSIIRLTQKARAVGIHVIMATQRPSVDVITALIKANCPARIAFQVSQKTDSRTILDMNGAESLLGKGDMLYRSPVSTGLTRMQAPLITEQEIESIVQETRRHGKPVYVDIDLSQERESYEEDDVDEQLFDQAWDIVVESGKTSTSYVQRRLRIGYNKAANLIERMEERGYLGPTMGNKPREILKRT